MLGMPDRVRHNESCTKQESCAEVLMQLTLYTDYAFRVLVYLGSRENEIVTVNDIAADFNISRNHLVKVVHHLGSAGLIISVRGKGGGIRLAYAPAEIRLSQVIAQTERNLKLLDCFDETDRSCKLNGKCNLQTVLKMAHHNFLSTLSRFTVADLLKDRSFWQDMLQETLGAGDTLDISGSGAKIYPLVGRYLEQARMGS